MKSEFKTVTLIIEQWSFRITLILLMAIGITSYSNAQVQLLGKVDFSFAPLWWQSVISLPDDHDKIVVGKEGQILFGYNGGGLRGFGLKIGLAIGSDIKWQNQKTYSAKIPIVITKAKDEGIEYVQEVFVVTPQNSLTGMVPRRILLKVTAKNYTNSKISRSIGLSIQRKDSVALLRSNRFIQTGKNTIISASEPFKTCSVQSDTTFLASLSDLVLNPSESKTLVFTIDRNQTKQTDTITVNQVSGLRQAACQWWENSDLPFDAVKIPDPGIQDMLFSCVRNIWQARDIEKGKIAFKVGPTVYRQLFMVDGAFLLETAALLGRAKDARDGLEFMLSHQEDDGSFNIIGRYYGVKSFSKENGIMLWTAFRHSQLSQDKEWLRSKWPALKRVVEVIQKLRAETKKNPEALDFGLVPGGYIDGGLDNKPPNSKPEFSNVYWNMVGMKAAIDAAHWLGDDNSANVWQPQYDEFYSFYRKAAARDMLKDSHGNSYIPIMMANAGDFPPAKGQWSFCQAVYPGGIFPINDPLVEGQLNMLRDTKVEEMVFDTGWMKNGLWTYFASFYGHAMLWQGHGREAVNSLYAFARHASPLRVWREEQKPMGKGNEEVGDMPHNWASAEFIRLTTHLLELDRGNELHLLEGFPHEWAGAGMVTQLNGVLTPFGSLKMSLKIAQDGKSAKLKIAKMGGTKPDKIVIHLLGLTGKKDILELPVDKDISMNISMK